MVWKKTRTSSNISVNASQLCTGVENWVSINDNRIQTYQDTDGQDDAKVNTNGKIVHPVQYFRHIVLHTEWTTDKTVWNLPNNKIDQMTNPTKQMLHRGHIIFKYINKYIQVCIVLAVFLRLQLLTRKAVVYYSTTCPGNVL